MAIYWEEKDKIGKLTISAIRLHEADDYGYTGEIMFFMDGSSIDFWRGHASVTNDMFQVVSYIIAVLCDFGVATEQEALDYILDEQYIEEGENFRERTYEDWKALALSLS